MGYQYLVVLGIMALNFAYHRWINPPVIAKPKPSDDIQIPRVEEGVAVPIIYGRGRVRQPLLAWCGFPQALENEDPDHGLEAVLPSPFSYGLDQYFLIGIPFYRGTNRVLTVWAGDDKLAWLETGFTPMTGIGNFEAPPQVETSHGAGTGHFVGGNIEFLDGHETQELVDDAGVYKTEIGRRMLQTGDGRVGGYRRYLSALLFRSSPWFTQSEPSLTWVVGQDPQGAALSFEFSSYPSHALVQQKIGEDANPVDVLRDILTSRWAKLAIPNVDVDYDSFFAAATICHNEGHGFSRAFEEHLDAVDMIQEVLRQIDGVIYVDYGVNAEDEIAPLIKIRLIRAVSIASLKVISPENCEDLEVVEIGSRDNVPNRLSLAYTSRERDYQTVTTVAENSAAASTSYSGVREVALSMPGVSNAVLAGKLAARELSAVSRPISKFRARVDRRLLRATPGEAYILRWPNYNINDDVYRVARVIPGGARSNKVTLELISDFFYKSGFHTLPGDLPTHDLEEIGELIPL